MGFKDEVKGQFPVEEWAVTPGLPRHTDGIHVRVGMVTTLDGYVALNGSSAGLGGETDLLALKTLRHHADCVLNASGTMIAEGLGPSRKPHVVVTGSERLQVESPLLKDGAAERVIIVAGSQVGEEAIRGWRQTGARVHQVAQRWVDVRWLIPWLRDEFGFASVICEGGPTLNAQLADAGLVDEWCVTLALTLLATPEGDEIGVRGLTKGLKTRQKLWVRKVFLAADEIVGIYSTHPSQDGKGQAYQSF